ncbi:MAG: hypothetical protein LUE12_08125 [Ruminococcus sp.]|nr:hypothetical protein [Ruminococcus sp.]
MLDEFEVSGLVLSNVNIIYTDTKISDCDNDGLLDGEEITSANAKITIKEDLLTQETITCVTFGYYANLHNEDSDGDGLLDGNDPYKLKEN